MSGTQFWSLVWEGSTCCRATKTPWPKYCSPGALEPVLGNKRSRHNEKPAHRSEDPVQPERKDTIGFPSPSCVSDTFLCEAEAGSGWKGGCSLWDRPAPPLSHSCDTLRPYLLWVLLSSHACGGPRDSVLQGLRDAICELGREKQQVLMESVSPLPMRMLCYPMRFHLQVQR